MFLLFRHDGKIEKSWQFTTTVYSSVKTPCYCFYEFNLKKKYKCHQHPHPGYDLKDAHTDRYLKEMAIAINKARITLTDTGLPRSRYGKYIEIPMCGTSAICGDLPDDKADDYSYVIEVTNSMTAQEIFNKICYYLDNEDKTEPIAILWSPPIHNASVWVSESVKGPKGSDKLMTRTS